VCSVTNASGPDETADAPLWLSEGDVGQLLSLGEAIDVLENAYRQMAAGAVPMRRAHAREGDAILHSVGGILSSVGIAGVKSWIYTPGGAAPLLTLWDVQSGALLGIVEAFRMGQWRTAGTSGLGTKLLARDDAAVLAVLGTGKQSIAQAQAVAAVREISRVQVFGRDQGRLDAFVDALGAELGADVTGTTDAAEAMAGADVITAITRAAEPFIDASMIPAGAHLNAVGSIVAARSELKADAVGAADVVVCDSVPQARDDSGELRAAADAGLLSWDDVLGLDQLVTDPSLGRTSAEQITLFKALGVGLSDVALGVELLSRARDRGLGTELPATADPHSVPATPTRS